MKWESLLRDILEGEIFGRVDAYVAVKETQKRTLPHAHALFTLVPDDKPRTPADIDRIVSAEIPDPRKNRTLYDIVTTNMIHGPCGSLNMNACCMKEGECKKNFPKDFCSII